jgi:UDP-2-acetamido-3-amino-2,3-dideoxy-glucuronate N-acetyltransferase
LSTLVRTSMIFSIKFSRFHVIHCNKQGGDLSLQPSLGKGVIIGKNVQFGKNVIIWNYVVMGDLARIGDRTRIGSFCDIGKNVVIGRDCIIQAHVTISNECKLGDNVFIGPNTSVLNDRFPNNTFLKPPIIENNVVIGGCVTILPNILIGENSMIAAGSVVTKDVPRETVVKGMPAKPMMTIQEYEKKRKASIKASQEL